jgi:hypothetical protein
MSEAQRNLLARLGIEETEGMTKGDAADAITTAIGSRRIDPVVAFMVAARG